MTCDYVLKIQCQDHLIDTISEVLGVAPTECEHGYWGLELTERGSSGPVYFVEIFLGILAEKFDSLQEIGINRSDVSIWVYCEYSDQCAMQFLSEDLKSLGENGIDLCIECWEVESGPPEID